MAQAPFSRAEGAIAPALRGLRRSPADQIRHPVLPHRPSLCDEETLTVPGYRPRSWIDAYGVPNPQPSRRCRPEWKPPSSYQKYNHGRRSVDASAAATATLLVLSPTATEARVVSTHLRAAPDKRRVGREELSSGLAAIIDMLIAVLVRDSALLV